MARTDRHRVATSGNLATRAEVLRSRRRAQTRIGAVPQRNIMRPKNTIDGVGQVLRLQISKLALLLSKLDIEQVVVDLRDERLQRNAPLNAGRTDERRINIAWIDKPSRRRGRRHCRLLKIPGRMASSRNLLDPSPKDPPAVHQVGNLSLIHRNFNRTRPNKVCCAMNIGKHRVHLFPFQNKKGAAAATPVRTIVIAAMHRSRSVDLRPRRPCRPLPPSSSSSFYLAHSF